MSSCVRECLAFFGLLLVFAIDSVDDLYSSCIRTYDALGYSQCGRLAFNGGCNEHFDGADPWHDKSGTMRFAECCAKCDEMNCKSFAFGKQGASHQNWCNIYIDVVCTDNGDTDWHMFIPESTNVPIHNSQIACAHYTVNHTATAPATTNVHASTSFHYTTDKTAITSADRESFFQRVTEDIPVLITIIVLSIFCVAANGYLFCQWIHNDTAKYSIQQQNRNNRALPVPKQQTATLTPPGTGVDILEYVSVKDDGDDIESRSTDIEISSFHSHMEGALMETKEQDDIPQQNRDDSTVSTSATEQMCVVDKGISGTVDNIDCELKNWLTLNGFAHYLNHFVLNGYDSLDYVKDMQEIQDLIDIGITRKADQHKLMSLIQLHDKHRCDEMDCYDTAGKEGEI